MEKNGVQFVGSDMMTHEESCARTLCSRVPRLRASAEEFGGKIHWKIF